MRQVIIVATLLGFALSTKPQNRIANSSFEFIKPGESSGLHNSSGQGSKIEGWYSQKVCCKKKQIQGRTEKI